MKKQLCIEGKHEDQGKCELEYDMYKREKTENTDKLATGATWLDI